jgi:twitching motility protein PilT
VNTKIEEFLQAVLTSDSDISDVNLSVGKSPQVEISGKLESTQLWPAKLTAADTTAFAKYLIGDRKDLGTTIRETGSCDCSHSLPNGIRTRVNIFTVRDRFAIVMRVLATDIPTFESLNLPQTLTQIPELKSGLVLMTGPTGSGKSTMLAALVDRVNSTRPVHIITLEDPVEFLHPHKLGTMNQREMGTDYYEYAHGLRAALRQSPKVIFVGEIRDRETVEITLKAAETGHLVLSTLHTIDAGQTINRLVGMFPREEETLIRYRLAQILRFVVAQRLLPKSGGGRVAALEIMGTDLRVQELIRNGEEPNKTFYDVIGSSTAKGWQTFDQHLVSLLAQDIITEEVATAYASNKSVMNKEQDRIKSKQGRETSNLGELSMLNAKTDERDRPHMNPGDIMPKRAAAKPTTSKRPPPRRKD